MTWARAHWLAGTVTLVLFALSGAYMRWVARVPELADLTRSVYRSRHLFILLAAVANLAMAGSARPRRVASVPLLIAPVFLLVAFWTEPAQGIDAGPWSQIGLYLLFGAAVALVLAKPRTP